MEDFVTWVDSSKVKRNILKYREKLDDFDLLLSRPAGIARKHLL